MIIELKLLKKYLKRSCFIVLLFFCCKMNAQHYVEIKGELKDEKNDLGVPYASVILNKLADSTYISATSSDDKGRFSLEVDKDEKYYLLINSLGYKTKKMEIVFKEGSLLNLGVVLLQENVFQMDEILVKGERIKAKKNENSTTFFMSKRVYQVTNNGVDVLKLLPGVQVDLMQNISLQGSANILILVDGRERDKSFINQINSEAIDKVELVQNPSAKYDGHITGVINIQLRKDEKSSLSGHIYTEIPTSLNEVYSFPSYSFNYGVKRLNLFTSYNGSFSYFDIVKNSYKDYSNENGLAAIRENQFVKQKNWSHRFNFGIDYFLNKKNQLSLIAHINPFSNEHDGKVSLSKVSGYKNEDVFWFAKKEDNDKNFQSQISLFYKHLLNQEGAELSLDLSCYNLEANNATSFIGDGNSEIADFSNTNKLKRHAVSIKLDYTNQINKKMKIESGFKGSVNSFKEREITGFRYLNKILALYNSVEYKSDKFFFNVGLRGEKVISELRGDFKNENLSVLPFARMNYKLGEKQTLGVSFKRTIHYPLFFELNPYVNIEDPFSYRMGTPTLTPELNNSVKADYSIGFGANYVSTSIFYREKTNQIGSITYLNSNNLFETVINNFGDFQQFGLQVSGMFKPFKTISLNGFLKVFNVKTELTNKALTFGVENREQFEFQSNLSLIVSFKNNFSASLLFQYNSARFGFQSSFSSDPIYFISLEKSIGKQFKIGIVSAVPFAKSITYSKIKRQGINFNIHSEGNVKMSAIPTWFKVKYQFQSNKKVSRIKRATEVFEHNNKKGF